MSFDPKLLLDYISFAIGIVAMVYAWFATRRKDVDRRFTEGSKRMDRIDARVNILEQEVRSLPNKDDFHQTQITLTEMNGEMKALTVTIAEMSKAVSRTEDILTRHEDYLRENN